MRICCDQEFRPHWKHAAWLERLDVSPADVYFGRGKAEWNSLGNIECTESDKSSRTAVEQVRRAQYYSRFGRQ